MQRNSRCRRTVDTEEQGSIRHRYRGSGEQYVQRNRGTEEQLILRSSRYTEEQCVQRNSKYRGSQAQRNRSTQAQRNGRQRGTEEQ